MARHIDVEQGTDEWLEARLGVPTASMFGKFITPTGRKSSQAEGYINQLIAERVTGEPTQFFKSEAMQRGNDLEPCARDMYELMTGNEVIEMGLLLHDTLSAGCSPDGLIGGDGGLEIKCPNPDTHVANLRRNDIDPKYIPQVQGCMWVTERIWWDFVSYHPQMEVLIVRVERDDKFIKALEEYVTEACNTIELEATNWRKL